MHKVKIMLIVSLLYLLAGCSYKEIEYPGAISGGYYNAYCNKNAIILYKRPSSKLGCWRVVDGWDCVRR